MALARAFCALAPRRHLAQQSRQAPGEREVGQLAMRTEGEAGNRVVVSQAGQPRPQSLDQRAGKPLAQRGQDEHVAGPVEIPDLGVGDRAHAVTAIPQPRGGESA